MATRLYDITGVSLSAWYVRVLTVNSYNSGYWENSPISHGTDYTDQWDASASSGSCDVCQAGYLSDIGYLCGKSTPTVIVGSTIPTEARHSAGANYAFWDGHVKWLRGASVSPGINAASSTSVQTTTAVSAAKAAGTQGLFANGTAPSATYSIL